MMQHGMGGCRSWWSNLRSLWLAFHGPSQQEQQKQKIASSGSSGAGWCGEGGLKARLTPKLTRKGHQSSYYHQSNFRAGSVALRAQLRSAQWCYWRRNDDLWLQTGVLCTWILSAAFLTSTTKTWVLWNGHCLLCEVWYAWTIWKKGPSSSLLHAHSQKLGPMMKSYFPYKAFLLQSICTATLACVITSNLKLPGSLHLLEPPEK